MIPHGRHGCTASTCRPTFRPADFRTFRLRTHGLVDLRSCGALRNFRPVVPSRCGICDPSDPQNFRPGECTTFSRLRALHTVHGERNIRPYGRLAWWRLAPARSGAAGRLRSTRATRLYVRAGAFIPPKPALASARAYPPSPLRIAELRIEDCARRRVPLRRCRAIRYAEPDWSALPSPPVCMSQQASTQGDIEAFEGIEESCLAPISSGPRLTFTYPKR